MRNRRRIRRRYGHAEPSLASQAAGSDGGLTPTAESVHSSDEPLCVSPNECIPIASYDGTRDNVPPLRRSERVCHPPRRLIEEMPLQNPHPADRAP